MGCVQGLVVSLDKIPLHRLYLDQWSGAHQLGQTQHMALMASHRRYGIVSSPETLQYCVCPARTVCESL